MGTPPPDDGSIERIDLAGRERVTIIPPGSTFTPKQLHLDPAGRKLYWSDREGMRVMRCDLDGGGIDTLVQTGHGDADSGDPPCGNTVNRAPMDDTGRPRKPEIMATHLVEGIGVPLDLG